MEKPLKPLISRMGGKTKLADRIISIMPPHKIYIEPFIGGGSIYFKKPLVDVNIINDIDPYVIDLYNDFKTLKSFDFNITAEDVTKDKFMEYKIKTEFKDSQDRFFNNILINKLSMWGKNDNYGFANTSYKRIPKFKFMRNNFDLYKAKFNSTLILNTDYKTVIELYDHKDALIYLDPPYSKSKKGWGYKDNPIMEDIKNVLLTIKGKFIMSYDYAEDIVKEFEKDFNVYEIETKYITGNIENRNKKVKEIIITNFKIDKIF
jgi:DNA adenine methylase